MSPKEDLKLYSKPLSAAQLALGILVPDALPKVTLRPATYGEQSSSALLVSIFNIHEATSKLKSAVTAGIKTSKPRKQADAGRRTAAAIHLGKFITNTKASKAEAADPSKKYATARPTVSSCGVAAPPPEAQAAPSYAAAATPPPTVFPVPSPCGAAPLPPEEAQTAPSSGVAATPPLIDHVLASPGGAEPPQSARPPTSQGGAQQTPLVASRARPYSGASAARRP